MTTIELTEEEIATLRQGLLAATVRYAANIETVREVQREAGIGAQGAQGLIEQFTDQITKTNALYVKIANADKITVIESD